MDTRSHARCGASALVFCVVWGACTGMSEESAPTAPAGPAEWRVAEAPIASIGMVEGDERYQLVRVSSAFRQADGDIVIMDSGRPALVFFDSLGVWKEERGGRGAGPGEFERISMAWPYVGDSIAVYDLMQQRMSVFDGDGRYGRGFLSPLRYTREAGTIPSQSCCSYRGPFADGSFAGHPPDLIPVTPGPPRYGTFTPMLVSADGTQTSALGTFESSYYAYDATKPNDIAGHVGSYAFRYTLIGDQLIGGNGLSNGLVRVRLHPAAVDTITLPGELSPFTAEARAEYEQALRDDYELRGSRFYEGTLESNLPEAYSPLQPRFVDIRSGADGRIWLQRWTPRYGRLGAPSTYEVFALDGTHVATLPLPPESRILWSGEDRILLLQRDSLDVQYVRLYAIETVER